MPPLPTRPIVTGDDLRVRRHRPPVGWPPNLPPDVPPTVPPGILGPDMGPRPVYAGLQRRPLDRLVAIIGQSRALVARNIEQGRMLTAEEAVACGLVDEVSA